VADVARVLVARTHARTAADAAALAVAQELALPSGTDPIDVAADYAARNDAILTACGCVAGTLDATVTVSIVVGGFLLVTGPRTVTARARAVVDMPAEAPPG
jgi:Flp pilus assembly protein TadG